MKLRFSGFVDVVELVLGLVNPPILQYINCALNNNHRANDTHSDDPKPFKWEMCDRRENSRFLSRPNLPLLGAHWAQLFAWWERQAQQVACCCERVLCRHLQKKLNLTFTISSSVIRFLPFVSPRLLLCWARWVWGKSLSSCRNYGVKKKTEKLCNISFRTLFFSSFFYFAKNWFGKLFIFSFHVRFESAVLGILFGENENFEFHFIQWKKMSQWEGNLKKKFSMNGSSDVVWWRVEEHGWM